MPKTFRPRGLSQEKDSGAKNTRCSPAPNATAMMAAVPKVLLPAGPRGPMASSTPGRSAPAGQIPAPSWNDSLRDWAWVTKLPGGTERVNQTLPPMLEPLPIVMRPRIVAPA
jgi:hypothetical protein